MTVSGALRRIVLAGAFGLLALASGLVVSLPAKAGGPPLAQDYAIDQFYDELAPFGDWVHHPRFGYVWLPRAVAPDWRPFTVGNWIYTEDGWYWDSHEPFAWAVYHYGRWGFEPDYGWYWVPGDTWAPAWVQWRYGDEYVGWAPEAPAPYGGYAYGGPARFAPPPPRESWVFVEPRYLTAPAVRSYALPALSLSIAFGRTTNVYRPEYRNGYVYNYGMPRDRWSRITRKNIEPRRVYRGHQRARPAHWNRRDARDLYVYAPGVRKGAGPRRAPKKIAHKPARAKGKSKNAKAGGPPRGRAMGLAPPTRDVRGGNAHRDHRGDGARGKYGPKSNGADRWQQAKPKGAKSKSAKGKDDKSKSKSKSAKRGPNARDHRPQGAHRSADRDKPSHAKSRDEKPNHAKGKKDAPKTAKANSGGSKSDRSKPDRSKSDESKSARGKPDKSKSAGSGQRHRPMALAPPAARTHSGRLSPNDRGPSVKGRDGKDASKDHGSRKPPEARTTPQKPKASKSKDQNRKDEGNHKRDSAKHKSSKPKDVKSAHARPKKSEGPHAKSKSHRDASKPGKAGKSGKGKSAHGKPKSAKACKGNSKRESCGRRG